ncbi:MAG: hypothetical protein K2W88_05330 [Pararheinheimera sp.]|nr:hypothetical protein [Rheinheimera sp.]
MKAFLWSLCVHIVLLGLLTYHHFAPSEAAKVKPEPPILAYAYQPVKAKPAPVVEAPIAAPVKTIPAKALVKAAVKKAPIKKPPVKRTLPKAKPAAKLKEKTKPSSVKTKTAAVQPQRKPFVPVRKPAMVKPMPVAAKPLPKPVLKQPQVAAKPLPKPVLKQPQVAAKPLPQPVLKQPEVVAAKPLPQPLLKQPEVVAAKPLPKPLLKQPEVVAAKPLPKPVLKQPEVVAAKPLPQPVLKQPEVVAAKAVPKPADLIPDRSEAKEAVATTTKAVELNKAEVKTADRIAQQEVQKGQSQAVSTSPDQPQTMANKTLQAARQGDASGSATWKEKQKQLALEITATKAESKPETGRKVKTFADGSSLIDTNPGCWKVPPAESRKDSIWLSTSVPCKADTTVEQIDAILQKRRSYSRD